jgi:hypothetical protein
MSKYSAQPHLLSYWVFGLLPLPSILENRKYDVPETGSLSILR